MKPCSNGGRTARSRCTTVATLLACGLLVGSVLSPLAAQQRPDTLAPDSARSDSGRVDAPPGPGGSFLRSALVPGWGQAAHGAYVRGGVYFAAQTGSWFMLGKTLAKLAEARDVERRRMAFVEDSLLAEAAADDALAAGFEDADSLAAAVAADSLVQDIRGLIDARKQQREDWIAWTVFWTLAAGADAFVTAHLSEFPASIVAEPRRGGGFRFGIGFTPWNAP